MLQRHFAILDLSFYKEKNYDIDNTTIVEWAINDKGNPEINFRKKRNFKNLSGAFKTDEKTNALELKRSLYK